MKKYAILKNAIRGINFGVVIKSDGVDKFYGWTDRGVEWSEWANKNNLGLSDLPSGISVGEFKNLSDQMMEKIIANNQDVLAVANGLTMQNNRQILLKSKTYPNVSKFPEITNHRIPSLSKTKNIAISYKVKHFKQSQIRSEISFKVRINELAFNHETKQFNVKPNRASRMAERHSIQQKMSRGQERQFGEKIVGTINKDILAHHNSQLVKREIIGSNTKEIVDFFVKGRLGYAIGRAARGAMPNRGRGPMRGMASRVIAGQLDPRMRRDVDGDGLIFDGTWREMPDPTRFKPNQRVQKPFSPDPNKPIGSQSLQIMEDAKKRQDEMSRIVEEASRGVRESIRRGGLGSRTASSSQPPNRPPQARKLMALDPKNSNVAKKITYDPYDGELTVSYNDGRVESFDEVTYPRVYEAGLNDDPDKLIFELEKEQNKKPSSRDDINKNRTSGFASQTGKPKEPKFARFGGERDKEPRVIDADTAQKVWDAFSAGKSPAKTKYRNVAKKFNLTPYEVEAHINFIGKRRREPFVVKPEEVGIPYEEANRKPGVQKIARTSFVDKKKPRGLKSSTKQTIEDAVGFMDSIDAGEGDWDSGLRKAWQSDGKDWGDAADLIASVTAKLSSQDKDFQKADEKEKLKKIKDLVQQTAADLANEKGYRYDTASLDSLTNYIGQIDAGRDADASAVIGSFDPDGSKSSRASALEAIVAYSLGKLGETTKDREKYLNSRGRMARFGSLIDDLLDAAVGTDEYDLENRLTRIKKGLSLSKDDAAELAETLEDIQSNNPNFKDDDRLDEFIKEVDGMRSSDAGEYDNLIEELQEASRGAGEEKFIENLNNFISGEDDSKVKFDSLLESLNDVLDNNELFENDRRLQKLIDDVTDRGQKRGVRKTQGADFKRREAKQKESRDGLRSDTAESKITPVEEEFADVVDDLVERSEGTADNLESLLKKLKNGTLGTEDNDWPDFLESLVDEYKNGDLQGKKKSRLNEFIKALSGVRVEDMDDRPRRGLSSSTDDVSALPAKIGMDPSIGEPARRKRQMDEAISAIRESSIRMQVRAAGAKLGKRRGLSSSTDKGDEDFGSDADDAIAAITKLKQGKKLDFDEVDAIVSMVDNMDKTRLDEDSRIALMDLKKQVLNQRRDFSANIMSTMRGLQSSTGGGDDDMGGDLDDAIAAIAKRNKGQELSRAEMQQIAEVIDNLDLTRLDEDSRIAFIDYRAELSKKLGSNDRKVARTLRGLKSSTGDDDFGSDLDDARAAIIKKGKGEELSEDEIQSILTVLQNADLTRLDEDRRIEIMDLERELKKKIRNMPGREGSVRTATREANERLAKRRPVSQPLSARMAIAATERASRPRGLSSSTTTANTRTEVQKQPKRRQTFFRDILKTFGVKKGEGDGQLWDSMSEEERTKTKEALDLREAEIVKELKERRFKSWWTKATEEGLDKQSLRAVRQRVRGTGGKFALRPKNDPLTKNDAMEMMLILEDSVVKGRIDKFQKNPDGTFKLDKQGRPLMTKTYGEAQRMLDDLVTILNMKESGDFSPLEHLHSGSRKAIHRKVGTANTGRFSGPGQDSSIGGQAAGMAKATSVDELNPAETGAAKKLSLGKKLLRVNEGRAARVARRAARRNNQFRRGRLLTEKDIELESKKARLRARAMKRTMLAKFRRTRDADELAADMGRVKAETSPISVDNAGKVAITPRYVEMLAKLDGEIPKTGSEKEKQEVYDQLLADLWENSGFSELPTLVTEEEVRRLIAAGWQPVIRGTGNKQVDSEGFVEQFLTNADARFIPGQGARMYGVGEYFAFPGYWTGYSGSPTDRHSILLLIPPSADIVTKEEIIRERDKMRDLTSRAVEATKALGGRQAAEAMTPGELAAEYRKVIPNLSNETSRSGQIVNQLVERLEELENMPASDEATLERKRILGAFDYLHRFTKQQEEGYFAPIIGVDGIDTNSRSGEPKNPFLLHNRTGVAAFLKPVTRDEAESLAKAPDGSRIGAIWRNWQNRADRSREGAPIAPKPKRSMRKGKASSGQGNTESDTTAPVAPQPTTASPKSAINTDAWTKGRPDSTGSNPAILLTDPNGTKYYTKLKKPSETSAQAQERMETEVLAGKLYELAGVPAADLQMGMNNGEPVMLSRMIQTRMPNLSNESEVRNGFVVDAWLANWDAPLNDNIKIDNNGRAVRLDVGGSLDYRAQGQKKGSGGTTAFGNVVGEMTSLQKSGGNVNFKNMDPGELKKQAQKLGTITDDDIRKTVSSIVSDPARAKVLADTLIARRDDIIKRYG